MDFWHMIHEAGMGFAMTSEGWDVKEMRTGIHRNQGNLRNVYCISDGVSWLNRILVLVFQNQCCDYFISPNEQCQYSVFSTNDFDQLDSLNIQCLVIARTQVPWSYAIEKGLARNALLTRIKTKDCQPEI